MGWVGEGWCKVIIISNSTSVKVDMRCIEVRFGELIIISPVLVYIKSAQKSGISPVLGGKFKIFPIFHHLFKKKS